MTQAHQVGLGQTIARLEHEWERLAQIAAAFQSWDELDQIDYLAEWQIYDDDLDVIAEAAAVNSLTPKEYESYQRLLRTVERNRPLLNMLLSGGMRSDEGRDHG
jgi:hypothetical protein